jgi:hypothetical protein
MCVIVASIEKMARFLLRSNQFLFALLVLVTTLRWEVEAFQGPAIQRRTPLKVLSQQRKDDKYKEAKKGACLSLPTERCITALFMAEHEEERDIFQVLKGVLKYPFRKSEAEESSDVDVSDRQLKASIEGQDNEYDQEDAWDKFKAYIKSFRGTSDDGNTALREESVGEDVMTESFRQKIKTYIKYPYTYMKHYFRGERQEEVDGFGDVIVSDETFDAEEEERGKDVSAVSKASTIQAPASATDDRDESSEQMKAAAAVLTKTEQRPTGERWAVSAPQIDLSGDWQLIATDDFKSDYDKYLMLLGQPFIVRSVALSIVGLTTEETRQMDGGKSLFIRGTNARGVWERTLRASGSDRNGRPYTPERTNILTVDKENVEAEAWWEENGTVHRSWLRGVTKYGGGDFESKRYLEQDGKVFVCETTFHPIDGSREKAKVTWRFLRQGETIS